MRNKEVIEYKNIVELEKGIKQLDRAVQFPVFYKPSIGENKGKMVQAKEHSAIFNLDRKHVAGIMSDRYTILQHQDAFNAVVDSLKTINTKIHGKITAYNGDLVYLYGSFTDVLIKDDTKQGMELGFRIANSYNMWSSFSGSAYTFRLVCSNGAMLKKLIPEAKFTNKHFGKVMNYQDIVSEFIKKLVSSVPILEKKVSEAIADTVEWKLVEKLLPKMILMKKHKEAIEKILIQERKKKGEKLSRWDIYNTFTAYVSHGEKISVYLENFLNRKAEQLLMMKDIQVLIKE